MMPKLALEYIGGRQIQAEAYMKKKRHRKRILKLLRSIDTKLGEIIDGQARLEALLEPGQSELEEVPNDGSKPSTDSTQRAGAFPRPGHLHLAAPAFSSDRRATQKPPCASRAPYFRTGAPSAFDLVLGPGHDIPLLAALILLGLGRQHAGRKPGLEDGRDPPPVARVGGIEAEVFDQRQAGPVR